MKKTAALLTAVFASLAMTVGASAQNIVNGVVEGAEDIVDGAGNAVEDIVDGGDNVGNEGVVTDDVPGDNQGIEPLNDPRPLAENNPGTGVDLMTTGAIALASAGTAYFLKKRSLKK